MSAFNDKPLIFIFSTYLIFACFCFTMFIGTWFFIPETKGAYSI
jgi:phage shock protein PspC (stress-responsive transcriptional regulator)